MTGPGQGPVPEGPPQQPGNQLRPTTGTAAAGVLALLAWRGAAAAGSRLGLFVALATVAVVVLDLGWAVATTRRAHVDIRLRDTDTIAGAPLTGTVAVRGPRCEVRLLSLGLSAPVPVEPPMDLVLEGNAPGRGVVVSMMIEVASRGLCGLAGFARPRDVPLRRPLFVGPRPEEPELPLPDLPGAWGDATARPAPAGDTVRGLRAYVPGDPARHVHWPATARTGELVVKEVDEPTASRLVLVVDLGEGGPAGEHAASRAAWYAGEARRRGSDVVLATAESGGPVSGPAGSPAAVNRRLAAAVPGPPAFPGSPAPGRTVLLVSDRGDSWH